MTTKKEQRLRRSRQTRARISIQRAVRLTVFRTNLHIYAQVIAEDGGKGAGGCLNRQKAVRKGCAATAAMSLRPPWWAS